MFLRTLRNFAAALLVGGTLATATAASAATISKTPAPPNPFDNDLVATSFEGRSDKYVFDKFDPSLGTLVGVVVRLDSFIEAFVSTFTAAREGETVDAIGSASFTVFAPGILAEEKLFPAASCTAEETGCSADGSESSLFTGDDLDPRFVVAAPDLALYVGPGTVDVFLGMSIAFDIFCSNEFEPCGISDGRMSWSGSIELDYIYTGGSDTPVPTPTTLLLFGAGLLVLAALTRNRTV
ncbi:MAG: choice-of-anchor E domain-containing protein [Alphaproteobacteria bacterium]|nr:choice-of-anchor E domain-containing protein [Alphaproteobacteria bacterium]